MCLALVALNAHPRLPLLIAANRDEFHARAAAPAQWWKDGTLGGVDLAAGGTWFGVDAHGRCALVTNLRDGIEPLFELLADRTQAEATALPATGIAPEWERLLSSAFIVDSNYGTRCSTVLTIARDGGACFVERSFDPRGCLTEENAFQFSVL